MEAKPLTASDVIRAVGGPSAFGRWWGADRRRVDSWGRRGFPANLYLSMSDRLQREHSINASPAAWNMRPEGAHQQAAE
jgi:hypothetical protein